MSSSDSENTSLQILSRLSQSIDSSSHADSYQCITYQCDIFSFSSDKTYVILAFIFTNCLIFVTSVFGLTANTVNILVFYRQGLLQDSCTASLVGLSVLDFVVCLGKTVYSVCVMPHDILLVTNKPAIDWFVSSLYLEGGILMYHSIALSAMSGYVTLYIALERMVSIVFPFHVKRIFTPKRTYVAVVCIVVFAVCLYLPISIGIHINEEVKANSSDDGLITKMVKKFHFVTEVSLRPACLVGIVLLNTILVVRVNMSRSFRKSTGKTNSSGGKNNSSSKEIVLTKMIITLCVVFAVCNFPSYLIRIQFGTLKLLYALNQIQRLTDTINSSFNIFIYATMSSRFKTELRGLFGRVQKE